MVSSSRRIPTRRRLFSTSSTHQGMAPWYFGSSQATLYNLLAAFIGGQILLTAVYLTRSAPPCDCRCQWRPEVAAEHGGKTGRSIDHVDHFSTDIKDVKWESADNKEWTDDSKLKTGIEKNSAKNIHKDSYPSSDKLSATNLRRIDKDGQEPPEFLEFYDNRTKNNEDTMYSSQKRLKKSPVFASEKKGNTHVRSNSKAETSSDQQLEIPEPFTILTTTNTAFSDLTENWLESLRRLGLSYNITLIAEDDGAFLYLRNHTTQLQSSSNLTITLKFTDKNASRSAALGFRTRDYIQLVGKRPHYILDILLSGLGVLFADADAVWLKDPIPLIAKNHERHDIWVALGEGGKIPCPCFMYIRPTPRAISMVKAWQARIEERLEASEPENDQTALSYVMHNHVKYRRLRVRKLDMTAFPTGQSMFLTRGWYAAHKDEIYVVHANKIGGYDKKKFVLRWKKLWYLGKDKKKPTPSSEMLR